MICDDATRCALDSCHRKLSLAQTIASCRCGRSFCRFHQDPEAHACTYDFRAQMRDALSRQLGGAKAARARQGVADVAD